MGIKRDKSSSAAAVNSLRAAASYPLGVNVVLFGFYIIKCTSCASCMYPAYIRYHVYRVYLVPMYCPCILCISCVLCVYILFVYRVYCKSTDQNINISSIIKSKYHYHYHIQIAGQYIVFW